MSRSITTLSSILTLLAGCAEPAAQMAQSKEAPAEAAVQTKSDAELAARVALFTEQVAALELQTRELEGLWALFADPAGPPVPSRDQALVDRDPLVISLEQRLVAAEEELRVRQAELGPDHPDVKQLLTRRDVVQDQLTETRERRLLELHEYRREQVRTAYRNSQHALLLANEKLAEARAAQAKD